MRLGDRGRAQYSLTHSVFARALLYLLAAPRSRIIARKSSSLSSDGAIESIDDGRR